MDRPTSLLMNHTRIVDFSKFSRNSKTYYVLSLFFLIYYHAIVSRSSLIDSVALDSFKNLHSVFNDFTVFFIHCRMASSPLSKKQSSIMFEKIVKSIEFDGKRSTFIHCCSFQIQECFLYLFQIIFTFSNDFG